MTQTFDKDRRILAYVLAFLIVAVAGYLGLFRSALFSPTIAAFLLSVSVVVLALLGVRNPLKGNNDGNQDSSQLERLARLRGDAAHNEDEARGPGDRGGSYRRYWDRGHVPAFVRS